MFTYTRTFGSITRARSATDTALMLFLAPLVMPVSALLSPFFKVVTRRDALNLARNGAHRTGFKSK